MSAPKNNFAAMSPENKKKVGNQMRRNGNPNWPGRGGNRNGRPSKEILERRKLFSEFLKDFYHANPAKLKKLVLKAHDYAMEGHARFLELILDRMEGPVKQEIEHTGAIAHLVSDLDRQRAIESVERIKQMRPSAIGQPTADIIVVVPEPIQEPECPTAITSSGLETLDSKPAPTT